MENLAQQPTVGSVALGQCEQTTTLAEGLFDSYLRTRLRDTDYINEPV